MVQSEEKMEILKAYLLLLALLKVITQFFPDHNKHLRVSYTNQ